jgi:hypothetical protein
MTRYRAYNEGCYSLLEHPQRVVCDQKIDTSMTSSEIQNDLIMRLLNSTTFYLEEIGPGHIPFYATLSQTWEEGEVTFEDMRSKQFHNKKGFAKIRGCSRQAARDGLEWVRNLIDHYHTTKYFHNIVRIILLFPT